MWVTSNCWFSLEAMFAAQTSSSWRHYRDWRTCEWAPSPHHRIAVLILRHRGNQDLPNSWCARVQPTILAALLRHKGRPSTCSICRHFGDPSEFGSPDQLRIMPVTDEFGTYPRRPHASACQIHLLHPCFWIRFQNLLTRGWATLYIELQIQRLRPDRWAGLLGIATVLTVMLTVLQLLFMIWGGNK